MQLQRMKTLFDPNCEQEALEWSCSGHGASIRIERFGNGPDNQSDFRILLTWDDIEKITAGMAAENHDGALRIQRALNLASAIEGLLKISD
jgi:hypothetical protein